MKRRTAIRNVILVSAGAALLHACRDKAKTTLKHIPLTADEEDLLIELTETIIPRTDFPGAKDLQTADFIFIMADDCFPPDAQQKFAAGLKTFTESSFATMSPEKRREFIDSLTGDAKDFFEMVKQGTIENFTSSQQYLKEVKNVTSLIPPKFRACVPINS